MGQRAPGWCHGLRELGWGSLWGGRSGLVSWSAVSPFVGRMPQQGWPSPCCLGSLVAWSPWLGTKRPGWQLLRLLTFLLLFHLPWAQTHPAFKGYLPGPPQQASCPDGVSSVTEHTVPYSSLARTRLPFQEAPIGSPLASVCTLPMMGSSLLSKLAFPASLYCYNILICKFLYVLCILYIHSYKVIYVHIEMYVCL